MLHLHDSNQFAPSLHGHWNFNSFFPAVVHLECSFCLVKLQCKINTNNSSFFFLFIIYIAFWYDSASTLGQFILWATSPAPLLYYCVVCCDVYIYLFLFCALCSCGYSCNRVGPWQAKILFYSRGDRILSEMAPSYEPCLAIFYKVSTNNFRLRNIALYKEFGCFVSCEVHLHFYKNWVKWWQPCMGCLEMDGRSNNTVVDCVIYFHIFQSCGVSVTSITMQALC
jgi:hypothetical protein